MGAKASDRDLAFREDYHPFSPEFVDGIPQIHKWRLRRTGQTFTVPTFAFDNHGRKYVMGAKKQFMKAFCVTKPKIGAYYTRTYDYALYLVAGLNDGQQRKDLFSEAVWHIENLRELVLVPGIPGEGKMIVFSKLGSRIKTFSDESDAEGWMKWFNAKRAAVGTHRKSGPQNAYTIFRSKERLDISIEERVYEITERLTLGSEDTL